MGIRFPLQTVLDYTDTANFGATSIVSKTFTIPQDADNIIVKVPLASIAGTNPVYDIYLQTSDDGGTTWYDQLRMPAITGVIANAGALWGSVPVVGAGMRSTSTGAASTASGTTQTSVLTITGNASMRGLAPGTVSGLPVLGPLGRIQMSLAGTIAGSDGVQVQVKVNSISVNA